MKTKTSVAHLLMIRITHYRGDSQTTGLMRKFSGKLLKTLYTKQLCEDLWHGNTAGTTNKWKCLKNTRIQQIQLSNRIRN